MAAKALKVANEKFCKSSLGLLALHGAMESSSQDEMTSGQQSATKNQFFLPNLNLDEE